jgi:hypothetical protein
MGLGTASEDSRILRAGIDKSDVPAVDIATQQLQILTSS